MTDRRDSRIMTAPEGAWRHNIGGFIAHYRPLGWLIRGSTGPSGFVAVKLDDDSRPVTGSPARPRSGVGEGV